MATKQKIISFNAGDEYTINNQYLEKGWVVKQMVAEHITTTGDFSHTDKGKIVVLLEKEE